MKPKPVIAEASEAKIRKVLGAQAFQVLNSHADAIEGTIEQVQKLTSDVVKLKDQMDAVLDGLTDINRRIEGLNDRIDANGTQHDAIVDEQLHVAQRLALLEHPRPGAVRPFSLAYLRNIWP